MRRIAWLPAVALVATLLPVGAAAAEPATTAHPRLLFSAEDVPALRARVAVPGSVHAAAWKILREKAEGHLLKVQPEVVRSGLAVPTFGLSLNGLERPYTLQNEMPTYLIELGMAYQLSGDPRFGRHVVELLLALGDAGFPYWCCQDLGVGDLLEGIGLGFDWTYELMTPEERAEIVADLTVHESELFDRVLFNPTNAYAANLETSNWMGVTTGGAGLALLAIKGEPGAPAGFDTYLAKAIERIELFFDHSVDPSGANEEGMTYAVYGLKNAVPFGVALQREGLGDLMSDTGLPHLARWAAFEQLPGEGQNYVPLNDSQRTSYGVDFAAQMFAIDPDNGVAQWHWQRTVGPHGSDVYGKLRQPGQVREDKCDRPHEVVSTASCDLFQMHGHVWTILWYRTPAETPEVDPATVGPLSLHHAVRGLVDARTGFDGGVHEVVSTFEARRDGRAHYHYDLGSFTLYGEGGRFAIDPGYSCVACKKPRAQMNPVERAADEDGAYANAHNVVLVDDSAYTQLHNSRFNVGDGQTIDSYVDAPNLTLTHADLRYAYDFQAPYAGRDHFFSRVPGRPVLLGITDHLQRDGADHTYTWQMLTNNDNTVTRDGSAFTITAPSGAVLSGRVADGTSEAEPVVQQRVQLLTNPTDDLGKAMPVVYTRTPAQLAMDQMTFMALTPAGEPAATTQTLPVDGGTAVGVTWKGVTDVLVRRLHGASEVTGTVETDALIAKLTVDGGETVIRSGTRLSSGGLDYVTVTGSPATVTVSGDAVQAVGDAANSYRVYAPDPIASVTVNGEPTPACRRGADVLFPCERGGRPLGTG